MIKNIIFDFGDVFINLDKSATDKQLKSLNIKKLHEKTLLKNEDYEKGLISTEDLQNHYLNTYPNLNAQVFVEAWNSILLDLPDYRLDFLKQLKSSEQFQLFLLSNTNDLHIKWVENNIDNYAEFKNLFDGFYLSHEINLRKPDPDIFRFVLSQNGLYAQDTLFIDDTLEHIKSANELNIHTWHLDPKTDDVLNLFEENHLLL